MEKYVVKKSFGASVKMMLSCAVMLAMCVYSTTCGGLLAIIGWFGVLFFGFCTLIYVKQILKGTLLVFEKHGFQEYTTALRGSFVPWENVTNLSLSRIANQTFVCVEICNAEDYISKLNPLQRRSIIINQALGFATIQINLSLTKETPQQILEKMLEYFKSYHENNK